MMRQLALIAVAVCISSDAAGAIVPIPVFTGQFSEGFEGFANGNVAGSAKNQSGPTAILAGHGTLSGVNPTFTNLAPLYVWNSKGGFNLGLNGVAIPFDGQKGVALQSVEPSFDAVGRIDFAAPVTDFGGYWVHAKTATLETPVTVKFYDNKNATIGSETVVYDTALQGISQWAGWSSNIPISAIEFTGFYAAVDGVQINLVPEPDARLMCLAALCMITVFYSVKRQRGWRKAGSAIPRGLPNPRG